MNVQIESWGAIIVTASRYNPSVKKQPRRLPTRSETATLLGMVLAIGSLFLVWERVTPPKELAVLPPLYANPVRTGFQTNAHWPLTVCACICGLMLLWTPGQKSRLPLLFMQSLCGLLCLMIPLNQFRESGFAPLPGVIVGLFGGALLLFGAMDRFTVPIQGL